ncbi:MAG: hypothetical protein ACE5OP_14160 [Candidatus Glassbacteria bacterium]
MKYDEHFKVVWVVNMAKHQTCGRNVSQSTIDGIANKLRSLHNCPLVNEFLEKYAEIAEKFTCPIEAPSRPPIGPPEVQNNEQCIQNNEEGKSQHRPKKPGRLSPSPQDLVSLWNEKAIGLQKVRDLTPSRTRHIRQRLKERSIEEWGAIIERITQTSFLMGENERGWKAKFNWLIEKPDPGVKILEGFYDNHRNMSDPSDDEKLKRCRKCEKYTAKSVTVDCEENIFRRVCQNQDCGFEETITPKGRGPPK